MEDSCITLPTGLSHPNEPLSTFQEIFTDLRHDTRSNAQRDSRVAPSKTSGLFF